MSIQSLRARLKQGEEVTVGDTTVRVMAPPISVTQPLRIESMRAAKKMAPYAKKIMEAPEEMLVEQASMSHKAVAACLNAEIQSRDTDDALVTQDEAAQIVSMSGGERSELVQTCMKLCGLGSGDPKKDREAITEMVDQMEGPTLSPEQPGAQ